MILIVGEAPGGNGAHHGAAWGRLARFVGTTPDELWHRARLANLLRRRPGKSGKGDAFPVARGRRAAVALMCEPRFWFAETVVLCGRRVATAFGEGARPYLERFEIDPGHGAVVVPHPSGVNLWYNDAGNRARVRRLMRRLLGLA